MKKPLFVLLAIALGFAGISRILMFLLLSPSSLPNYHFAGDDIAKFAIFFALILALKFIFGTKDKKKSVFLFVIVLLFFFARESYRMVQAKKPETAVRK